MQWSLACNLQLLTCDAYAFIEQLHELLFRILKESQDYRSGYLRSQDCCSRQFFRPAELPPHCLLTVQALALRIGMPRTELELVQMP